MSTAAPLDPSPFSRICNSLLGAIKEQMVLPRLIVIVPDDNIVSYIESRNDTSSYTIGKIIHWMMSEFNKLIASQKDFLPNKAKCTGLPHICWIEA